MKVVFMSLCFWGVAFGALGASAEIDALFPDGGLRYKSCQINLSHQTDGGYVIDIKRDCPSNDCYNYQTKGSIEVNAQQMEVLGKTLTNHHEIDRNSKTTTLKVKEYREWNESVSLGASVFSTYETVLVGHFYRKLEMRIDNETGKVEKFQAYSRGSVNWGAAIRGGLLTVLRSLYAVGRKQTLVDCESPGQEMHKTIVEFLEDSPATVYENNVLSDAEQMSLDAMLLEQLSKAGEDEYVDGSFFGNTPLHYAARHGLEKFARRLINVLPPEATDRYYRQGNPINFENSSGDTPLHLAVKRGQGGMVKLLLATKGIDTHIQDYDDKTAQQAAVDNVKKHCEIDVDSPECSNAQKIAAMFDK